MLVLSSNGCAAEASQPGAFTAEFGVSAQRFYYTEYSDAGTTLDRELGGIPGLSFRFGQRLTDWEWESSASYHYGRVAYTGQTQAGVPYNTQTDEGVGDVALRLGRWFGERYPIMPYAGLGYRRWDRNIQPGAAGGLFESYRWGYAWLGAKVIAYQRDTSNLVVDIGWIKPIDPAIYVDFRGAYNIAPSLNLASQDGLRLMLTSHTALPGNITLILEPYFEYWQLGRSPNVTYRDSVTNRNITVYEPASKTKNLGVNLRLGKMF